MLETVYERQERWSLSPNSRSRRCVCTCWWWTPTPAMRSACAEIAASLGYAVESTGDMSAGAQPAARPHRRHSAGEPARGLEPGAGTGLARSSCSIPHTAVIAMTASGSVNAAVEAMRCGASDYLTKPFAMDELSTVLDRAAQRRCDRHRDPAVARAAAALRGTGLHDRPLRRRWRSSTASSPRWRRARIRS